MAIGAASDLDGAAGDVSETLPGVAAVPLETMMGHPAMPRDSPSATRGVARAQQAAPLRTNSVRDA
ncbi:MAG: hypothetical protein WBE21_01525 [Candidatus Acidiferrales bacterium]